MAFIGVTGLLVLTGFFLLTVQSKFHVMAKENALGNFSLIGKQTAERLSSLFMRTNLAIDTLASRDAHLWIKENERVGEDIVEQMTAVLRSHTDLYSVYFASQDDEFLQVVAVRGAAAIAQNLDAPADTQMAVRRIVRTVNGSRVEYWRFLSADRQLLAERRQSAAYRPSERPWFKGALAVEKSYLADPYVFASTGRLGFTLARSTRPGADGVRGVVGADLTIDAFQDFLAGLPLTPGGAIFLSDEQQRLLGHRALGAFNDGLAPAPLSPLSDALGPIAKQVVSTDANAPEHSATWLDVETGAVLKIVHKLQLTEAKAYSVTLLAPISDFTGPVDMARREVLWACALLLAVLLPLSLFGARQIAQSLSQIALHSERIRRLDFSTEPRHVDSFLYEVNVLGQAQEVMHQSLKARTQALESAQAKLSRLVENGIRLGQEQDREKLLQHILHGGREIANCVAGTLFLKTEQNTLRFALRTSADPLPSDELPLHDPGTGVPNHQFVATHVALTGETVVIDDVYKETRFDLTGTKRFSESSGMRTVSMLAVPMRTHEGEVIGLLQFMNALDGHSGEVIPFDQETVGFVEALAAQAAVALENQALLKAQEALMDSLIKLIAGAIDAKSPYTGGHCERVPELAMMLAREAAAVTEGPLADFGFKTDQEWREFRIGAWLHDCGKVITPEYVVDKATKLETIFNRIHEIRTRFEVLLRDAEIAALKAVAAGQPAEQVWSDYEARRQQLMSDFAFVAEINLGGELMAPERLERLNRIAQQTWWRHFDDRLGLSDAEAKRYAGLPPTVLPTQETLLADKPQHIIHREEDERTYEPKHGFQIKVPTNLNNHGEIYNLSIARGTLTEEERFKINEHIIQTIIMLSELPLPKSLKRVPEYAGTHHETLIGTGYPKKLKGDDLSVPSRIMAIADIFEALTASDRPYKKAKTLTESIKILSFFKKDGHIDPVLFDLFLSSGVYMVYAQRFLQPEQIDEVDIAQYLGAPASA